MSDLSLFDIERGLHDLFDAWQEAEGPEQVAQAELAIRACAEAEVRKVDGIRKYLRFCDQMAAAAKYEASQQRNRQAAWEARRDRLKEFVYDVMANFGLRKLEGQTGALSIRGNGGLQPLVISDPALVPDELCDVTVTMSLNLWEASLDYMRNQPGYGGRPLNPTVKVGPRTPSNERIREALAKPCEICSGTGRMCDVGFPDHSPCPECHGAKTASVAGARLEPRGESVVVK